ncbi:hypothetical protein OG730_29290 [Streptomyces sp. NBC_01298]|uniref:hypothetical protein n=1 Tax=Streptomyces sp. NBC_01298 TaxID=2903817 RepID=UPI002E0E9476|nr:hypothetical protein OG730_29290 [Streptomyces sp. NBC_01298]
MRTLNSAVRAVVHHRRPAPWCWEAVVTAVGAGGTSSDYDAEHALRQAGHAVAGHADRIAACLSAQLDRALPSAGGSVGALALALAGMGDTRAVPALRRLAQQDWLPYGRPWVAALARMPAADLLPVLLPGLRRERKDEDPNAPVLELLGAWGPAAAPAVPDVLRFLGTPFAHEALRALGRIGPPAAAAADALAAFATGRDPRVRSHHPGPAAWAHWKVTGDATLALAVCGAAVRSGGAARGLPFLADLGPAAAGHADAVRGLMESPGTWTRIAAAHAYARITGDPEPAVPVLLAAVDPAWTGHPALPTREAVRRLGEIGGPAAAALPVLRTALASEERLSHPGARGRILADEAYVRTLTGALERIDPGGPTVGSRLPVVVEPGTGPAFGSGLLRGWRAR